MALHPWRFGGGLLLWASLLAGSSVAVDPSETPARLLHGSRQAFQAMPRSTASTETTLKRQSHSAARTHRTAPAGQDWLRQGAWGAIEEQIRKPVERPATLSIGQPQNLRARDAAGGDDQSPSLSDPLKTDEPLRAQSSNGNDRQPSELDTAATTAAPLTSDLFAVQQKIRNVLALYQTRQLNTRDHNSWEMMHAIVAYGLRTEIRRDGPGGPPVNAVGWLLSGGRCRGQLLVWVGRGRPRAEEGVGVQGHPAQLLAILAQSRANADTTMRLGGRDFLLQDLIDEEMLECRADSELTFKLISFAHYLKSDAAWRSRDGQAWSIPRLIGAEIKAPIRGAACGGTHRLMAITYAYKMREMEGRPLDGEFLRAKQYITSYQRYAWSLQNPDGSFSTEWFARRGNRPDIDRKLQTSGHILEWLVFSLSDEELREPRALKSVEFLVASLAGEPNRNWSIGPLGHALHALAMYDQRVFGPESPDPDSLVDNSSLTGAGESEEELLYDESSGEPADTTVTLGPPQGPLLPGLR